MVKVNIQTEILLELILSSSNDNSHENILKKSIPVYVKKLNCFIAGVLMKSEAQFLETILIPFVAKKSNDWVTAKDYFIKNYSNPTEICNQLSLNSNYYYAYNLNTYGILILGRKKPFTNDLLNELKPITNHLGKNLIQAKEIAQRIAAEKSLRESELCLRTLSESTSASILIYNKEGIIYSNPAAEKLTGYSSDELNTMQLSNLIHPKYLEIAKENNPLILPNSILEKFFEIKIIKKNGKIKWGNVNSGLINWMGQDAGIISAFDITKRKKTEKKLIIAKEEAEKSERLKSAFLANMSHEIRTPMNGILGFSELLKTANLSEDKKLKYIEIIEKSGARMLNLINDIIDISKIEANLMKTSLTQTNVNEQLEYVKTFFKPEATSKELALTFKFGLIEPDCIITTDKEKFSAILLNLVKNAIKYTNEGFIEVGYQKNLNNMLEFYVKDSGIGIPKDRQQAIFERFIQADIDDKQALQGAGLGLAICKAFVEMLGGEIWVTSKKNNGSTFYFTIPYKNLEKEIEIPKAMKLKTLNQSKKLKILLAEDDITSKLLIDTLLEPFNADILEASNGIEAVDICRKNPDLDLILMDIKMPILDGYSATQQIREFNKSVVVIAQTAYTMVGDKEKTLEAGCNDYISKPINNDELTALIYKYFN